MYNVKSACSLQVGEFIHIPPNHFGKSMTSMDSVWSVAAVGRHEVRRFQQPCNLYVVRDEHRMEMDNVNSLLRTKDEGSGGMR